MHSPSEDVRAYMLIIMQSDINSQRHLEVYIHKFTAVYMYMYIYTHTHIHTQAYTQGETHLCMTIGHREQKSITPEVILHP
jgi:hypothetical protein